MCNIAVQFEQFQKYHLASFRILTGCRLIRYLNIFLHLPYKKAAYFVPWSFRIIWRKSPEGVVVLRRKSGSHSI